MRIDVNLATTAGHNVVIWRHLRLWRRYPGPCCQAEVGSAPPGVGAAGHRAVGRPPLLLREAFIRFATGNRFAMSVSVQVRRYGGRFDGVLFDRDGTLVRDIPYN